MNPVSILASDAGTSTPAFDGVFASIPDALIATDTDGTIVRANNCAGQLLSYQPSEMCGMSMEQLISDRFRSTYSAHHRDFMIAGNDTAPELEISLLTANGNDVAIDATVGRFEEAERTYVLMVLREVTDRVATEERLERLLVLDAIVMRTMKHLNVATLNEIDGRIQLALIDLSVFAKADRGYIFEKSEDGTTMSNTYEWCSAGTESRIDRLPEFTIGALPWMAGQIDAGKVVEIPSVDQLPPEAFAERDFFGQAGISSLISIPMLAGGNVVGFLGFNSHSSGHLGWSADTVSTLLVIQDFFTNALRRKRIEKELQRARRMAWAVTNCNDALVRATDESTLLKDVCQIVVETGAYMMAWVGTALNDEERSVRPIAQFGGQNGYLDDLHLTWANTTRGNGPAGTAIRNRSPFAVQNLATDPRFEFARDSALKSGYASAICVPFVLNDESVGVLAVYAGDVAAFDDPEIEVLQRFADDLAYGIDNLRTRDRREQVEERLRETLRTKTEFIATIAHELRTPLTAVVGFAQILTDPNSRLSASERLELVKTIANEGIDLTNIIDDLLVAAKAEAGTLTVNRVELDLRAQAAQVLNSLGQPMKEIDFTGESVRVSGDPARVRQILRNLVSNAVRYGGDQIRVSVSRHASFAQVTVIDKGSGVPDQDQEAIFEPYQRAHNAPGLTASIGLGLTISRQLARLMDGDVTYRRVADESIFTLTLPRTTV
ncbi:MAG: GAF domain-containing protein [Acidimicrobiia bacterium]|nr:GAF domain-containing protein [Acidimicrobiia bacterium]